jgi:CrcB protein
MLILGLYVAGMLGAPARYLVDGFVVDRARGELPVGTFVVNVTGSLFLGFLTGLALYHAFPATPRALLGTGFCGAYTTFSTFAYELIRLAEDRERRATLRVLIAFLTVPAIAAAVGMSLAGL